MNKSELIDKIAADADITKTDAGKVVDAFVGSIIASLGDGEVVALPGFGKFKVSARSARTGRHPKTGQEIHIPATKVPVFSPGQSLKDRIK